MKTDLMAEYFPIGCGRGGKLRRSAKSIARSIDASVRRAVEITRRHGHPERTATPARPAVDRALVNAGLLRWFDALKIGDTIKPGNDSLPIVKRNANAVFTNLCRWSVKELTGISPKEAAAIRLTT